MKTTLTFVVLLLASLSFGQDKTSLEKPKVDERVELLSIVFRLAGNHEYSSETFKHYSDKIWEHYAPYKDHELIQLAREVREKNGVGYDAVMSMAIHLDDSLNPRVPFTETVPDGRWGKEKATSFVKLLKAFYKETNSRKFFSNNEELYKEAIKRFLPIYEQLDVEWYKDFYGKEASEKFVIVIGLGNGGGNYGRFIDLSDGKREVYAIMGTWETDSTGMAEYSLDSYFPTLVHEFNHSFVNDLLNMDPEPFRKNGEIMYEVLREKMERGAYSNWQTMLNEALVRAAVVKYMKDHRFSEKEVSNEVTNQLNRGFIWIEELLMELEKYDEERNRFPTLESYVPELVEAYDQYAIDVHTLLRKNEQRKARFISLSEFRNGDTNVDPNLSQISINFDRPFAGANFIRPGIDGKAFPDFRKLTYSENGKTVILDWVLEENTEYQFILIDLASDNISPKDVEINFKTR